MRIIVILGKLLGWAVGIIPRQFDYLIYTFSRAYYTERYFRRFKSFGKGSKLARDLSLREANSISVGSNSSILSHCVLECIKIDGNEPSLIIGNNCSINEYNHITCVSRVTIGNDVLTGRYVLITDNSHGEPTYTDMLLSPLKRKVISKGPVIIGDRVWIGDKATILPGVTVGECSIIGANSVVTKDIPPYSVACGNPAKVIKSIINH